jgi:hypothetical protein
MAVNWPRTVRSYLLHRVLSWDKSLCLSSIQSLYTSHCKCQRFEWMLGSRSGSPVAGCVIRKNSHIRYGLYRYLSFKRINTANYDFRIVLRSLIPYSKFICKYHGNICMHVNYSLLYRNSFERVHQNLFGDVPAPTCTFFWFTKLWLWLYVSVNESLHFVWFLSPMVTTRVMWYSFWRSIKRYSDPFPHQPLL